MKTSLPLFLALFLAAPQAPAQVARNAKLLGRFNKYARYSDVWGYTAPNGKEYALLGVYNGLAIIDASNPVSPTLVAFFSGARSTWRDIKTWKNYVYVVTEAYNQGMWIIDMSNPASPKMVNSGWGKTIYTHCHNIAIDTENGIAYLCGTNVGMVVADLKNTPTNPKHLTTWRGPYVHDLHIQHGLAHLAEIYTNRYRIVDVTKLPTIRTIGLAAAPGRRYCHNTWATRDDRFCLTTNETASGPVGIFDITVKSAPKLIARFQANPTRAPSAIPHNVLIRDRIAYISYYTEGVRVVDISNPKTPVEVGYYDTWSGSSFGYNGDWGVYALNPSGNVFVSDISSGLYIVKPAASGRRYGSATPGTGGGHPVIHQFGAAFLGNANFALEAEGFQGAGASILVLGGKAANISAGGLTILVELVNPPALIVPVQPSAGAARVPLPVPNDPRLIGANLYAQWFQLDPAASAGLSASRGLQFQLFAK